MAPGLPGAKATAYMLSRSLDTLNCFFFLFFFRRYYQWWRSGRLACVVCVDYDPVWAVADPSQNCSPVLSNTFIVPSIPGTSPFLPFPFGEPSSSVRPRFKACVPRFYRTIQKLLAVVPSRNRPLPRLLVRLPSLLVSSPAQQRAPRMSFDETLCYTPREKVCRRARNRQRTSSHSPPTFFQNGRGKPLSNFVSDLVIKSGTRSTKLGESFRGLPPSVGANV